MSDYRTTLYRPEFEKDSCGFGLIAHMDGEASHWLVATAIQALTRMTHRGAVAADGKSGDGCGILIGKPDAFLREIAKSLNITLADQYASGLVFLSLEVTRAAQSKKTLDAELSRQGLIPAGWRSVPINPEACGEQALLSLPLIEQVFVNAPADMAEDEFSRRLFVARRLAEKAVAGQDDHFYITSLSAKVLSYKGLVMPANLSVFYLDLQDARLAAQLAVFHQRFSTNTLPRWRLAQPFRFLAHNGEINTISGNRHWALARAGLLQSKYLPNLETLQPIVSTDGSDSASLDNMLEVLVEGGMDIFQAMRLLIPPAWQNVDTMDPDLRAFYEFHSMHMEPWDGPAGIVFTDGRYAACIMDRNGLRPARYVITKDRHITLASEVGVWDYLPEAVVTKGRLKPGQMFAVDTQAGQLLYPEDIDQRLKTRQPYKRWLQDHMLVLQSRMDDPALTSRPMAPETLQTYQKLFGVTYEERDQVIRVLAESGQEAVGSMGDDAPFPIFSKKIRSLYDSFRQQFAQVTNPPIDPLREQIVMSLETCLGAEKNIFEETSEHAARVVIDSPVLSESKFNQILALEDPVYAYVIIDLCYDLAGTLKDAIMAICEQAEAAVKSGKVIVVLDDRQISKERLPIPALLATGAVHHHLVDKGLRCRSNIVVCTGSARDPHHFAVLIGYGATAIYPYLAYEVIHDMVRNKEIKDDQTGQSGTHYRRGINKGFYKIISKMGISTIVSYRGAQLFEAIGLHDEVIELCFKGTVSRIQGANFQHLDEEARQLHWRAYSPRSLMDHGGLYKYVHGGEYHAYNPDVVGALQTAVRTGEYEQYEHYKSLVDNRPITYVRDMLRFRDDLAPISIDEVEPAADILKRFDTAGMSLGALSPEAHEALAIAMNRLGGRSNSGEGGEDPSRYGTERMSKIKQVASGRFGVTPHYLVNAEVLQIKIAQGAKPGEGGQLPGHKVNEMIARLRYSRPGVALISPPPHHDIYSIEDLAQLIFDLKQINPKALVSVKLVSEPGVGTIAAGVTKAYADLITISGYDGGTGASPLTSVKYAGTSWELGLAEAHQTLRANDLRDKVRLQTDGGLKTGLDVIKAAILGAESFGFGTAPMIALGCKYLRVCHLNNCATGVATQHKVLRSKHFTGLPEMVMNYFHFLVRDVREWMAHLGVRSMAELIGRTDLLVPAEGETAKMRGLDMLPVLSNWGIQPGKPQYCVAPRNQPFDKGELAEQMVADTLPAIAGKLGGEFHYQVKNFNRSIGARLSGEIAQRYGNLGMAETPISLRLQGTVGQSFGAWNAGGLHMYLEGDANDYVGKGMAGGKIVISPPKASTFEARHATIMGNTCLYGATGGKLFGAGQVGERFAVRNSGAQAIVEGVGDHGCEYMTGGVVVVLGQTGLNFGAGMTGGAAFVLDADRNFVDRYNHELIDIHRITTEQMDAQCNYLYMLITEHVLETGSRWGQEILDNFSDVLGRFWLVKPKAVALNELLAALRTAA